jgi:hypothetical protein
MKPGRKPGDGIGKFPGSGRKKGTPNTRTREIQEVAANIVGHPEVHERWLREAIAGTLAPTIEQTLLWYAFGKPKDRIEHSGDAEKPLVLILRRGLGRAESST